MSKNNYSYKVYSDICKMDEVEPFWLKHQHYPYHDFEYYKLCSQVEPDFVRPNIIAICNGDEIECLVISTVNNRQVSYKFGYKRFSSKVRTLDVSYCGVLGEVSQDCEKILLEAFFHGFKTKEYDQIFFQGVNIESNLYKVIRYVHPKRSRDLTRYRNPHWYLNIPDSYDQFYQKLSKKTKSKIRRECNKRIPNKFGDQVEIRIISEKSEIKSAMDDIESIAKQTYQRKMGVGFRRNQENQIKWEHYAERGMLRLSLLYLEKKPVAYWSWIVYKNSCLAVNTGYDTSLSYFLPGLYLFINMIKRFCDSQEFKVLDFGFGDASYKHLFGDKQIKESNLCMFAPNLHGLKLQLLTNSTINLSNLIKTLLQKINMEQKIKQIWRKKLRKQPIKAFN